MPFGEPLDVVPIWGALLATVVLVLLAIEGGFRLGWHRRRCAEQEDKPPIGEIVAATLGLLAFLLAFTFGVAASRFDTRRSLLVDEANAIGTTYLRAAMLPEPYPEQIRSLLRDYVELRLKATEPTQLVPSIAGAEELQTRLWSLAVAVGREEPRSIVVGLFIESLNDVIDLHTKRLCLGLRNRIPSSIWAALYLVTVIGMFVMGYHGGLSGSCRSLAMLALVVAFSAVMTLIVDLDRPKQGVFRVSQQAMIDLQRSMTPPSP